jgi:hypothetical protein
VLKPRPVTLIDVGVKEVIRRLDREMRNPVRKLDQEMPTNHSVTIRNCYIENCETGVRFSGVQNALVDGLHTKNVRKPIVDRRGRRNTYRNLYFEN